MDELQTLPTANTNKSVNRIGDKGAGALSEALKTNTTLQSLDLECKQNNVWKMDELQTLTTANTNKQGTTLEPKEHKH